jgi:hypothetical protein
VSTDDYQPVDDLLETPPEAPEPRPEPRTRSVRRPAKGRQERSRRTAQKRSTRKPPAPEKLTPQETIRGILQVPATAFILAGQRTQSIPLVADGATILVHGPAFAEAAAQIAEQDPRIMALLEKLVTFGPYGMFVTVCVIAGTQFRRNHDEKNAALLEELGAVPPDKIIDMANLGVPSTEVSPNGQGTSSDGATSEN